MLEPDAGPTWISGSQRGVGHQWPAPTRLISLSANAPEAIEVTMNSLGYEYQSDFARRYVAQGQMEIILKQLAGVLARYRRQFTLVSAALTVRRLMPWLTGC